MKISFCIATYKRPDRLRHVLNAIANQSNPGELEVIVSDNDPEGSASPVCADPAFGKIGINYAINEKNLGMVGNFNRSLARATGDYIVFNTDDDLPLEHHIETLRELAENHPGYGAYFGAPGTMLENQADAKLLNMTHGMNPQLSKRDENAVTLYDPGEFIEGFFTSSIFPYFLWSTGMVRSDIARKVGGMPDYGSPYFTDFCYLALAGAEEGMAVRNTMLGYQTIHRENFGKGANESLSDSLLAAHRFIMMQLPRDIMNDRIAALVDRFFGWWAVSQLVWTRNLAREDKALAIIVTDQVKKFRKIPFFKPLYPRYIARAYFPWVGQILLKCRQTLAAGKS